MTGPLIIFNLKYTSVRVFLLKVSIIERAGFKKAFIACSVPGRKAQNPVAVEMDNPAMLLHVQVEHELPEQDSPRAVLRQDL